MQPALRIIVLMVRHNPGLQMRLPGAWEGTRADGLGVWSDCREGCLSQICWRHKSGCLSSKIITLSTTSEKQFNGRLRSPLSTAVPAGAGSLGDGKSLSCQSLLSCLPCWPLSSYSQHTVGTQKLAKWINEKHYSVVYCQHHHHTVHPFNGSVTWPPRAIVASNDNSESAKLLLLLT